MITPGVGFVEGGQITRQIIRHRTEAENLSLQNVSASTRGSSLTFPLIAAANGILPRKLFKRRPTQYTGLGGIVSGATGVVSE